MRRTLFSFVALFCLMILFVSSASCLAIAPPPAHDMAAAIPMHTQASAPDHACCPSRNDGAPQMSTACCTIHHQPAATSSIAEQDHAATASTAHLAAPLLLALTNLTPRSSTASPPLPHTLQILRI